MSTVFKQIEKLKVEYGFKLVRQDKHQIWRSRAWFKKNYDAIRSEYPYMFSHEGAAERAAS